MSSVSSRYENGDEDIDIYEDLPEPHQNDTILKLQGEIKELNEQLLALRSELETQRSNNEKMCKNNVNLSCNISCLYKTASAEIERKDNIILELRRELDNVLFRRRKGAKVKQQSPIDELSAEGKCVPSEKNSISVDKSEKRPSMKEGESENGKPKSLLRRKLREEENKDDSRLTRQVEDMSVNCDADSGKQMPKTHRSMFTDDNMRLTRNKTSLYENEKCRNVYQRDKVKSADPSSKDKCISSDQCSVMESAVVSSCAKEGAGKDQVSERTRDSDKYDDKQKIKVLEKDYGEVSRQRRHRLLPQDKEKDKKLSDEKKKETPLTRQKELKVLGGDSKMIDLRTKLDEKAREKKDKLAGKDILSSCVGHNAGSVNELQSKYSPNPTENASIAPETKCDNARLPEDKKTLIDTLCPENFNSESPSVIDTVVSQAPPSKKSASSDILSNTPLSDTAQSSHNCGVNSLEDKVGCPSVSPQSSASYPPLPKCMPASLPPLPLSTPPPTPVKDTEIQTKSSSSNDNPKQSDVNINRSLLPECTELTKKEGDIRLSNGLFLDSAELTGKFSEDVSQKRTCPTGAEVPVTPEGKLVKSVHQIPITQTSTSQCPFKSRHKVRAVFLVEEPKKTNNSTCVIEESSATQGSGSSQGECTKPTKSQEEFREHRSGTTVGFLNTGNRKNVSKREKRNSDSKHVETKFSNSRSFSTLMWRERRSPSEVIREERSGRIGRVSHQGNIRIRDRRSRSLSPTRISSWHSRDRRYGRPHDLTHDSEQRYIRGRDKEQHRGQGRSSKKETQFELKVERSGSHCVKPNNTLKKPATKGKLKAKRKFKAELFGDSSPEPERKDSPAFSSCSESSTSSATWQAPSVKEMSAAPNIGLDPPSSRAPQISPIKIEENSPAPCSTIVVVKRRSRPGVKLENSGDLVPITDTTRQNCLTEPALGRVPAATALNFQEDEKGVKGNHSSTVEMDDSSQPLSENRKRRRQLDSGRCYKRKAC